MLIDANPKFRQDIISALQDIIYQSLYDAMAQSLDTSALADPNKSFSVDDIAKSFADAGKKSINMDTTSKLVNAIDSYIKSAGISVIASPQATLTCAAGPVAGVINVAPINVMIS